MPEGRLQSALYAATVTEVMLAMPSLGGFAGGITPLLERPRPIVDPTNRSRTLSAGMGEYEIFVPDIRRSYGGPYNIETPPPDPDATLDPPPIVDEVDVDIDRRLTR